MIFTFFAVRTSRAPADVVCVAPAPPPDAPTCLAMSAVLGGAVTVPPPPVEVPPPVDGPPPPPAPPPPPPGLVGFALTTTVFDAVPGLPTASAVATVTWNVPACVKVWLALTPLAVRGVVAPGPGVLPVGARARVGRARGEVQEVADERRRRAPADRRPAAPCGRG